MSARSPVQPNRIAIEGGPVALSALDYGGDGEPLLLLHGQADLAWSVDSIAQSLCDRYHVVAPDTRGHGESAHAGAYSIPHLMADVSVVTDHLGWDRLTIVAHSLGGHIGAQWASLFPDRVVKLVLIEGIGPPTPNPPDDADADAVAARAALALLRAPMAHRPMADVDAAAARLTRAHRRLDPTRARFLAQHGTRPGPEGGLVWSFDPRTRDWIASVDHRLAERRWRRVTCPVLVVTGGASWEEWWGARFGPDAPPHRRIKLTDAEFDERVAIFPDSTHVVIDDAGHLVHYDQPDHLNEVIAAFL